MNKARLRFFNKIKGKYRPYVVGSIVALLVISTIFAYNALGQQLVKEEKIITNSIEEKITFDYLASVNKSTLYPNGGIIVPDGVIFSNLTEKLIIQLEGSINTGQPVEVESNTRVTYSLIAKDMWEREFEVIPTIETKTEGVSNSLLKKEIEINLQELLSFINLIEEETLIRTNYLLVIKPKIQGIVYGDNNDIIHEINSNLEIPFELSNQYIKYTGESNQKEFTSTKILEEVNTTPLVYKFLGKSISIQLSRFIFSGISIISFIALLVYGIEIISSKEKGSEANLIDKKYKSKIIVISDKIFQTNLPQLQLINFKKLLLISEEKEEPILKYTDDIEGVTYYYVLGTTAIYYYKTSINVLNKGSEIVYDA